MWLHGSLVLALTTSVIFIAALVSASVAVALAVKSERCEHEESDSAACKTTSYIFGNPLPYSEKSVIVHELGFSNDPSHVRGFLEGSDCVCQNIACHRRRSEFCVSKDTSDGFEVRTRKSYPEMNPYPHQVGVIFPIDMDDKNESYILTQLSLVIRACYPWVAVLCSFHAQQSPPAMRGRQLNGETSSGLFPWLRECCDAALLPSRKFTVLSESQIIYRRDNGREQDIVFTLDRFRYTCNKCGVATVLRPAHMSTPYFYQHSQKRSSGKQIPIAARHRDAYIHLGAMEPRKLNRVNVTGGYESTMIESLAQPRALNFTYFYMGNASYWSSGGGSLINGTFDGMLDLLSRRVAILAVSNQKPFNPADKLFTFTASYDVDTLPFASRIIVRPVAIDRLFQSFGRNCAFLLIASTICFSVIVHILLRLSPLRVQDLFALVWFFSMRLLHDGFCIALLARNKTPPQVKWLLFLWAVLALVFNSMFNGVWVTFIATPPFKGVIDNFGRMKDYIARYNATAFMSPGLFRSATIYGPSAKVLFDNGQASTNSAYVIERLRTDKARSFWFYERIFLIYALNKHDPNGSIHISSDYLFIQPQCWVLQKSCALEANISRSLNLFRESGLILRLKKRSNVLELPPHISDGSFKPVKLSQIRDIVVFLVASAGVIFLITLAELCVSHRLRKVEPREGAFVRFGTTPLRLRLGVSGDVGARCPLGDLRTDLVRRSERRFRPAEVCSDYIDGYRCQRMQSRYY